ncbi:MAG: hypothetical protein HY097_04360 [Nitrospinae bacterium]|nr:hypothetical protein [Nitrospinota bacterium]
MDTIIEERVDRVEIALERFINEMREFKDEMREFKDEMREFKDEMREFKDEMGEFKDEMGEFKDEMREFKNEAEKDRKRMNKQWGELANKLGTLVEDIAAPSIPRIAEERFKVEIEYLAVRVKKKKIEGLPEKEWDAIAVSSDTVFSNYTKTTLRAKDVDDFLEEIKIF